MALVLDCPPVRRPLLIPLLFGLVWMAGCAPRSGGPGLSTRGWERQDLWAREPVVEQVGRTLEFGPVWQRRVAHLGAHEVRDRAVVPAESFAHVPWLPASEVHALEQVMGSRLAWRLELGDEPYFSFIPLRDETHHQPLIHRVAVRAAGGEAELLLEREAPQLVPPGQATETVDLALWAGQSVELLLEIGTPRHALPGFGPAWGQWASPAVYSRKPQRAVGSRDPRRPNVLLLGADTLRADALGAYASKPAVTPALDRLAAESDLFLDAISCFNVTNPSFLSLMTGLYGKNHGVYDLVTPLPAEHQTLAELFTAAGYETAAVISARHLGNQASGIGQGFGTTHLADRHHTAELAVDLAMDWMAERRAPFFAWVHLFDPHTPHTPPAPFALGLRPDGPNGLSPVRSWLAFRALGWPTYVQKALGGHRDLYVGEVAYLDRQVDRLLGFLASRGLLESTIVVFVADHGENLEDHGIQYGHHGLFETTTHVPLMIRWPGETRAGRRLSGLVQNVDLFPTLLGAAGLSVPPSDGTDLLELFASGRLGRRAAFSEHAHQTGTRVRTATHALMRSKGNRFVADGPYLFDLEEDPGETTNLAGRGLPVEAELERVLKAWLAERRESAPTLPADISEEDVQRLRALGYL